MAQAGYDFLEHPLVPTAAETSFALCGSLASAGGSGLRLLSTDVGNEEHVRSWRRNTQALPRYVSALETCRPPRGVPVLDHSPTVAYRLPPLPAATPKPTMPMSRRNTGYTAGFSNSSYRPGEALWRSALLPPLETWYTTERLPPGLGLGHPAAVFEDEDEAIRSGPEGIAASACSTADTEGFEFLGGRGLGLPAATSAETMAEEALLADKAGVIILQPHQQQLLGTDALPTLGSAEHSTGRCKPCAFVFKGGCASGVQCKFCHLCQPGEKKKRKKEQKARKLAGLHMPSHR
eukprot:TRINITY_DN81438_c0_g1_i1.p1 TRINITY_DN81438_c0_g1~~TRINITY_DN81438_c0_g1_i1.p1  ORF type:complete len:292 (+),score=61.37 TRINITY_DN81438_c0_g1_i1:63-938(+)